MAISIGDTAPDFSLPAAGGGTESLRDGDPAATVVYWTCNHCPYALAWHDRMLQVDRDYADRGVRFLAVNSNDADKHPADSFEAMVEHAREAGYVFDYLYDESQDVARALGAERTPEAFVYDAERRLVYHGAVDDNRDEPEVTAHYLRDAIDAALAGEAPKVADTPPVGCTVKWRR
jgi:peroxiredoxin